MIELFNAVPLSVSPRVMGAIEKGEYSASSGTFVSEFESAIARTTGTKWAVATTTGSAALMVAVRALTMMRDDVKAVHIRTIQYVATINALVANGITPVIRDVRKDENYDICRLHLGDAGNVIDAAGKFGSIYHNIGDKDLVCFSFNGNKVMTTGQGGAVCGNDPFTEARVRTICNSGRTDGSYFVLPTLGSNYRMSNINAALGLDMMERALADNIKHRTLVLKKYREKIDHRMLYCGTTAVAYVPQGKGSMSTVEAKFKQKGIETREWWQPLHWSKPYAKFAIDERMMPCCQQLGGRLLQLPCHPTMSLQDIEYVAGVAWELLA